MSKGQTLRVLVNARLTAAAQEIFVLFERTIAEYEEELCRSKQENQRKQELDQDQLQAEDGHKCHSRQASGVILGRTSQASCAVSSALKIHFVKTSKGQTLRVLVNARLTAAAQEIFVLFERTIAEYEEELCRSKQENQRKRELLDSVLSPRVVGLNQEIPQIKEELEEQSIKQEEEQLLVQLPEASAVRVKTEESSPEHREETQGEDITTETHSHRESESETEHSSDTDYDLSTETHLHSETEGDMSPSSDTDDEDWRPPFKCSAAQMETDYHDNQVQSTAAADSGLSAPEAIVAVTNGDMSGTAEGDEKRKFHCPVCQKRFKYKKRLKTHVKAHKRDKPFRCSTCPRTFLTENDLHQHALLHTIEEPFSCPTCKKSLRSRSMVVEHMRSHTGERPFRCSICKKSYPYKGGLAAHKKTHTEEKPFRCSTCQKSFALKSYLDAHMRTHTEERPFRCSMCNKTFIKRSKLDTHMRNHTGERPYSCSACNKKYAHKNHLTRHMETHTRDKRHRKSTPKKSSVAKSKHKQASAQGKAFSCSTCKKAFLSKTALEIHMRVHTGEKPYSCSICSKRFSQKSNLNSHMRNHSPDLKLFS